jgi:retron-type reverse transcriptase
LDLDKKLRNLAKKHHANYTRYADDLTFSSKTNEDLDKIIPKVHSMIKHQGFTLNYEKIRVMRTGGRQTVTGLTVNEKVNTPRFVARNLRAKIHQLKKAGKVDPAEEMKLIGYIGFVKGANPDKADKLFKQLQEVGA